MISEGQLNEIVEYVYNLYEEIQQLHEIVKLGDQEIISRSDCVKLINWTAKYRQIFTIEFIKRTTGQKRVMNGLTGVRRYVNGVGMPYDNVAAGLMTVYDMKAPGGGAKKYRQVPVDNILRLKIKGRVFKVVDDAQYNNINKPFQSKAPKDTDAEPVKGMDAPSSKSKAGQTATTDQPNGAIDQQTGEKGQNRIFGPVKNKVNRQADSPEIPDEDNINREPGEDEPDDEEQRPNR